MKLFQCFVFVSLVICVQALKTELCSNNDTRRTATFATAIVTALEKLSTRTPPLIYVYHHYRRSCQQEYIFEKVMEENRDKFLVQAFNYNPLGTDENGAPKQDTQRTLIIADCDSSPYISYMPILFYCPGMTINDLRTKVTEFNHNRNGRGTQYLVEGENSFIDLYSYAHFTANQRNCRGCKLVRTNRFLIEESRWLTNEFGTEQQQNFNGCELVVGVGPDPPYQNYIEHKNGTIKVSGLIVDIMKIAAKTFNFSPYFISKSMKIKRKYSYFHVDSDLHNDQKTFHPTQYLHYVSLVFLVPPDELYSDAEKLFMPLELEVWIATFVTILIALVTIHIINRMSQQVQDFVFGRNVTTPTLNVMAAFVGGAQTTLPGRNFARFLLMLFIFFSLIIRTCHQSKLFAYLQADIIKSEIQSIDELIEQKGLIYVPSGADFQTVQQRFEQVIRYNDKEPQKFIEKTLKPGFKGAILTSLEFLNELESRFKSGKTSLKLLKKSELNWFKYFPHPRHHFLKEQINEVIGRLQNAGLIELWFNKIYKFDNNKQQEESGPKPLAMDHFTAGFTVSLSL